VTVSPAAVRRPASRQMSERGVSADPVHYSAPPPQLHQATSPAFSRRNVESVVVASARNDGALAETDFYYHQSQLATTSPAFTRRSEGAPGHQQQRRLAASPAFSRRALDLGDHHVGSPMGSEPWQNHRYQYFTCACF
jgi:hypothetical protein